MAESITVASEVLSYCTSCKMDLTHTVAAMRGDKIAKVECKTCKKTHAYRVPKGVSDPPAKKKKAKKSTKQADSVPIEVEWEKLMAAKKESPSKPYSLKTRFALGDKLAHPTFGEGIVDKLIFPNKVEVIFKSDVKVLIHGPAPQ